MMPSPQQMMKNIAAFLGESPVTPHGVKYTRTGNDSGGTRKEMTRGQKTKRRRDAHASRMRNKRH